MTCGIYVIKNIVNNKVYVGQSVNIEQRIGVHKAKLRHNSHWNKHLQSSWLKDSENLFEFKLIEECTQLELSTVEIKWINCFNSCDSSKGYNSTSGGEGGRQTSEVRQRMSEKAKGRAGYWTGKSIPLEARLKMSEAAKKRGCCKPTKALVHLESGVKYKSSMDAAKALFPDKVLAASQVIYNVAKGKKRSYRKTTWKFED